MALDQVNPQVLLLHSEQDTLDQLSAVIDDRYTVHCATSGSEALQTLGETPIHVIVSAQRLPGMSGAEALREARKRSPETVGILLAGSANDGSVGALVGEKEFFQVVRGGISETDLNKLLSEATQKLRLLALAESANDGDANPDEPVAEHIVMEASENGSATISDGTGTWSTLPLDDESVDGAAAAAAVDVLVLSKDGDFLTTVQESSRATHVVRAVSTLAQAEQALAQHDVGVAVVDAGMVGDKVEMLTGHLQRKKERLVCIVAGRREDGEMLMDLVNRGKVYRFLLKPVSPGRARLAVEASVKHHLEAPDSAFGPADAAPQHGHRTRERRAGDSPAVAAAGPTPDSGPASTGPAPDAGSEAAPGPAAAAARLSESGVRERPDPTNSLRLVPEGNGGSGPALDKTVAQTVSLRREAAQDPASGSERSRRRRWTAKAAGMALVAGIAAILVGGYLHFPRDDARLPAETAQQMPGDDVAAIAPTPSADPDPEQVATELIAVAEAAMLERRLADAEASLDKLRGIDPKHARLPFLTTQLARMQLRDNIYEARAAIEESRFADAADALAAARALDSADTAVLDALSAELSDALSARQIEDWLARAARSADAGRLISPPRNNARHYFALVLESEPDNAAARQGQKVIAGKLVLQAMQELDQYRFDVAESLLAEARTLDPASSDIAASADALADARERLIDDQRRDEDARRAETRAQAQRLAALQEQGAQSGSAADPDRPSGEAAGLTATPAGSAAADSVGADSVGAVAAPAGPPPGAEFAPAAFVEAQPLPLTSATDSALKSPVAVSSLTRTRYVAPKYPRSAQRRNQSGWVDVVFTVAVDGSTKDIEIKASEPGDVFVASAVRAVEKWEFEPVLVNGVPVERRANIRMMFAIE